jgi:small-conductance mechanosensitive channel
MTKSRIKINKMEEYIKKVNAETRKSLSKLSSTRSKSVSELAKKFNIFTIEIQRLNKKLPEIGNNYIKENNLGDEAIEEIRKINAKALEDFIKKANVPGTNPDIKIKV